MLRFVVTMSLGVCLGSNIGSAQTTAPKQPLASMKTGPPLLADLTGKVFIVIRSGDLKPARFAQVFVLSGDSAEQFNTARLLLAKIESDFQISRGEREQERENRLLTPPSEEWLRALLDSTAKLRDSAMKTTCDALLEFPRGKALDLAKAHPDEVVTSDTDENGFFRIGGLQRGAYTVLVSGRAGASDGYWVENVLLDAGKESAIKMHSPAVACFDL